MKKIISLFLACSMFLSGCGLQNAVSESSDAKETVTEIIATSDSSDITESLPDTQSANLDKSVSFSDLSDPALLEYIEDTIYSNLVDKLNGDTYFVENVSAKYISKEYLDELEYNSKSNIYFGYSLEELDAQFEGSRYTFTLGDDGQTAVRAFEKYDDTYEQVIKNVAIGTGVILVCVVVSVVTGGVGAAAISTIFAVSAKTGAIAALSSGALGGVAAGVVTGIETKDFDKSVKAAALAGSKEFKWGAIFGALTGGLSEGAGLYGAMRNGLTLNEAAIIQKESKYPLDVIKRFKNMEQYNICKEAGLTTKMVNGKAALIRDIDLNYVSELGGEKVTNLQRMKLGYSALEPATGLPYELHHIGQKVDSTLAILTKAEHMKGGNDLIWHDLSKATEVHANGNSWLAQRSEFWKAMAEFLSGGL